jgi:CheY-like chemotaxis protein
MGTPHAATVLVVDDEVGIRSLVQELLEDEGYRVLVAKDGAIAFAVAQRDPPDLIVSDLMMPGMDGRTLATRLHNTPATAHIPVVLMSTGYHPQPDDTFVAVIHKPFDVDVLLDAIRTSML